MSSGDNHVVQTIMNKKKLSLIIAAVVIIIAGIFLYKKYHIPKEDTRSVYEALVQVNDQKASSPDEDKRSSLKKGDVIAVFPEGHPWTDTEKTSYLIVKIKMTPEDADKLTEPVTKEAANKSSGDNNAGPQQETIQARKYHLNVNVPTVNDIMIKGQPYKDKIFDSGIIKNK